MEKICPACGYSGNSEEMFCPGCGAAMIPAPADQTAAPKAAPQNFAPAAPVQPAPTDTGAYQPVQPTPAPTPYGTTMQSGNTSQYGNIPQQSSAPQYGSVPQQSSAPQYGGIPQQGGAPQFGNTPPYGAPQGYPQQNMQPTPYGNYTATAPKAPNKKKTGIIIGAAAAVVVLIIVLVVAFGGKGSHDLDGTYSLSGLKVDGEDYSAYISAFKDDYSMQIKGEDCKLEMGDEGTMDVKINQTEHYLYGEGESEKFYFSVAGSTITLTVDEVEMSFTK